MQNIRPNLDRYLAQTLDEVTHTQETKTSPTLKKAMGYSLLAPGKRIRPRLVEATSALFALTPEQFLPIAGAIEIFHCSTLIHDDLPCLDDDDLRRGQASNHKVFGEGMALLAGDTLIVSTFDCFLKAQGTVTDAGFLRGLSRLVHAMGARGVMGGQGAEMELTETSSLAELKSVHRQKTGALFEASVLIPADFRGLELESVEFIALQGFSRDLGEAFQILDDFEDREQDQNEKKRSIFGTDDRPETVDEVLTACYRKLEAHTAEIERIWSRSATALLEISAEISRRLRKLP